MRKLLIKVSLIIMLSLQFSYTYAEEALVIKNSSILDFKEQRKKFYGEFIIITIQDKPGEFYNLTLSSNSRSNEPKFIKYQKTEESTIIPLDRDVVLSYGDIINGDYKEIRSTKDDSFFVIMLICIFFGLPLCVLPMLFNLKLSKA